MVSTSTVVLDTSVWISGIFFGRSIPALILRAWRDGRFEIAVTAETLAELERTLQEKAAQFQADLSLSSEWMAYIRAFARVISSTGVAHGVCHDPDDDKFLDAALSSGAAIIVSGDHDLQALGEYQGVKVLSPRAFAALLGLVLPTPTRSSPAVSSSRRRPRG